jgi:hypothetical protein
MKSHLEKMLSGEPYESGDRELKEARRSARLLLREINAGLGEDTAAIAALFRKLLGPVGRNPCKIIKPVS